MFPNKMSTRAACVARYGAIDFASRHWPNQSQWLRILEIPADWFPQWFVLDTQLPVTHIAANVDMHAPLLAALKIVHDTNLGHELRTFDGCFNIRMVRGTNNSFSAHSYGLALDMNAKWNPMDSALHTTWSPQFVRAFTDQGFDWGGAFHGRKDPMHFSYCFE